jgi:putative endonuclease
MSPYVNHVRGRDAEDLALDYLTRHGLALVARNFRCRRGELDLVLRDGEAVVVAEIRCRTENSFGTPAESVDARKQGRLVASTLFFMQKHPELASAPLRFDVVSVSGRDRRIEWIRDAFRA